MELTKINHAHGARSIQMRSEQVMTALRVENIMWNGHVSQIAHYPSGYILTQNNGLQYVYVNGSLVSTSNNWSVERINGTDYVKHIHSDGGLVYSGINSQFVVF